MNNYCFLVVTTINYSDLWEPCFSLLEKNKPSNSKIYVATDDGRPANLSDCFVVQAGKGAPQSSRILKILGEIREDYVVFMLDDYFVNARIDGDYLEQLIVMMSTFGIDYLNFSKKSFFEKFPRIKGTQLRCIAKPETYDINERLGIWKKEALGACLAVDENPWETEVQLSSRFAKAGFKGCFSKKSPISYFHGVCKGEFFRRPHHYLVKNSLYHGNRPKMTYWKSIQAFFIGFFRRSLPGNILRVVKRALRKRGREFLSD